MIQDFKQGDLITFTGCCTSWNKGLWTIHRVTEKAILIDDEWLPKSQIVDICMIEKRLYDADCNYKLVTVPELLISKWFDNINHDKRQSSCAY